MSRPRIFRNNFLADLKQYLNEDRVVMKQMSSVDNLKQADWKIIPTVDLGEKKNLWIINL